MPESQSRCDFDIDGTQPRQAGYGDMGDLPGSQSEMYRDGFIREGLKPRSFGVDDVFTGLAADAHLVIDIGKIKRKEAPVAADNLAVQAHAVYETPGGRNKIAPDGVPYRPQDRGRGRFEIGRDADGPKGYDEPGISVDSQGAYHNGKQGEAPQASQKPDNNLLKDHHNVQMITY